MVILGLLACAGDLSNATFYEDAEFRRALPSGADLTLAWPVELVPDEDDAALLGVTLEAMGVALGWGERFVLATAALAESAPGERGEDHRVWGPAPWQEEPGLFLRAELSRTRDRALYGFGVSASETSAGPWAEFITGRWSEAPPEGEGWRGEATWGPGVLDEEARVVLRYGAVEGLRLGLTAEGAPEGDLDLDLSQAADLSGRLRLWRELSLSGGEDTEDLLLLSQWDAEGAGRADARVSGGDLGLVAFDLSQCWAPDGALVWQVASEPLSGWPALGDEAACPEGLEPADLDAL